MNWNEVAAYAMAAALAGTIAAIGAIAWVTP
jgi:hypothetical protein